MVLSPKRQSNSLDDSRGHAMVWWATHNWSQSRTYNSSSALHTTTAPAPWLIYCFTFMRENSLVFTKLSCPSSNMHSFISSSLNWKAMLNKAKKMFAQCLKISQKVSFYVIRSEETKINVRIYFLARKFKYLTYLWYQRKNRYLWRENSNESFLGD